MLGTCDHDYWAFLELAESEGDARTQEALRESITELFDGGTRYEEGPTDPEVLREAIVSATNLGFLLEGIAARPLRVAEVRREPWSRGTQIELALEDPWVGEFSALLFMPDTDPPHVGLVAHPGHWEDADEHRDLRHVDELVRAGFAVAVLDARAHEAYVVESDLTEAMIVAGHIFMGVRVYETLLLRRELRARADVHPDRIALTGHSGGSSSGNLAVRLDDGWAAYASDFVTEYLYATPQWEYVDETVPDLHRWFPVINDLDTASVPSSLFEYGFPEGGAALASGLCGAM